MADFFDFQQQFQQARRSVATPRSPALKANGGKPDAHIYTVTQLTAVIDKAIKSGVPPQVVVQGEVSNCKLHGSSGHLYLTLKDADNCIDCVMFRSEAARLKFRAEDGMEILATGRVGVYGQRGRYQLYLTNLQPMGQGALELAFQQLRSKLEKEGLFEKDRKKPLPAYPLRIAMVTSKETAAFQDMLKVLRRFSFLRLMIYHVPVQGDGSAEKIAEAIEHVCRCDGQVGGIDAILLGRGGGSLEDLWEFNEECLARAMCASRIPIVTGIGHEVDVSIADLVADHHAHTPTEAAQVVTGQWKTAPDRIDQAAIRLRREMRDLLQQLDQRLIHIERHEAFRRPLDRINQLRQRLDDRQRAMDLAMAGCLREAGRSVQEAGLRLEQHRPALMIRRCREKLESLAGRMGRAMIEQQQRRVLRVNLLEAHLHAVGPEQVLKRGYTITQRKKDGAIIKSAGQVKVGERVVTRFAEGQIESTVEDPRQPKLFE